MVLLLMRKRLHLLQATGSITATSAIGGTTVLELSQLIVALTCHYRPLRAHLQILQKQRAPSLLMVIWTRTLPAGITINADNFARFGGYTAVI